MADAGKQTALFFGFLTAAMTYASAQAAQPVQPQPAGPAAAQQTVVQKTEADRKLAARIERELGARGAKR